MHVFILASWLAMPIVSLQPQLQLQLESPPPSWMLTHSGDLTLTRERAPASPSLSFGVSVGTFVGSLAALAVAAELNAPQWRGGLALPLTLAGIGLVGGSYGPSLGDLLNGNFQRMFWRGSGRLLLGTGSFALVIAGVSEIVLMFVGRGNLGAGVGLLVAGGLAGAGWLGWGLFDAFDARHAPDRWVALQET